MSSQEGTFYLIEQLDPHDPPSVIWRASEPVDFSSLKQAARNLHLFPELVDLVTTELQRPLVSFEERERGPATTVEMPGDRKVVVWPVPEPRPVQRMPWGLLLWIGPASASTPHPPPRAATARCDPRTGNMYNSPEMWLLSAANLDHYRDVNDPADFFGRTLHHESLDRAAALLEPDTPMGSTMAGSVTLRHDDGHAVHNHYVGKRCRDAEGNPDARSIAFNVTRFQRAPMTPETAARLSADYRPEHAQAFVTFRPGVDKPTPTAVVVDWVPAPPPWFPHWDAHGPVEHDHPYAIHPDDHERLHAAAQELDDHADRVDVRARLAEGRSEWREVPIQMTAYPGAAAPMYILHI